VNLEHLHIRKGGKMEWWNDGRWNDGMMEDVKN
jgi:hypothetical protein